MELVVWFKYFRSHVSHRYRHLAADKHE